ncbi:MAG: hypothetical protein Q7R58_01280 [bacterium]|nr:hypothetical protein [bacterium]
MTATSGLAQVNALATNTALSAWSLAGDFLIVLILFAVFFLIAWYVGRGSFVALLLAFYGAYALYVLFPYKSYLPIVPAATGILTQVGLYVVLVLLFYMLLRRIIVSDFLYIGVFGLIILSLLAAAFLIALAYHVFPGIAEVYQFTPAIDILFAQKAYFFWWFAAPAVGLFFLAR